MLLDYYSRIRTAECDLHLEALPPIEAVKRLVSFSYDWHLAHPAGVRLVMVENMHRARDLATLDGIEKLNFEAIERVGHILRRGEADGSFRKGVSATDLYLSIASLCFFRVSNRATVQTIFAYDMTAPGQQDRQRSMIIDMILRSIAGAPKTVQT